MNGAEVSDLIRRAFQWRKIGVLVLALGLATIVVFVIESTRTFRISQDRLETRLDVLENENQDLTVQKEKATAQANTSVDQLVKSGETPIIASPDVLTVSTTPGATTTALPAPGVPQPNPAPPTVVIEQPPAATPVPTTSITEAPTTTTEAPPVTEPTLPPTTEPPVTTDTTAITIGG